MVKWCRFCFSPLQIWCRFLNLQNLRYRFSEIRRISTFDKKRTDTFLAGDKKRTDPKFAKIIISVIITKRDKGNDHSRNRKDII